MMADDSAVFYLISTILQTTWPLKMGYPVAAGYKSTR